MANGYFIDGNWSINTEGNGRPIGTLTALLITPVLGLTFLMFLPFIGFYLCLEALIKKVVRMATPVLHPTMMVGEAHLTGHGPSGDVGPRSDSPALEELAKEIDRRRK